MHIPNIHLGFGFEFEFGTQRISLRVSIVCELQHSVSTVTKRTFVKGHTKVIYPKYSKHSYTVWPQPI